MAGMYMALEKGVPPIIGDGNVKGIATGDIFDRDGNKTGALYEALLKAINDWGKVLRGFDVQMPSD